MAKLWKLLSFLLLLTICKLVFSDLNYDIASCSTTNDYKNYSVFQNTVLYFRSPDFPKTMRSHPVICKAQFVAHEDNSQLWLIMYNGMLSDVIIYDLTGNQDYDGSYDSNKDILSYVPQSNIIKFEVYTDDHSNDWMAHEAVVLSFDESTNNSCSFGSEIINLEENKMIPITTNLGINQGSSNCTWRFKIGTNEILKFVIKKLSNNFDSFQIYTDGNLIDDFFNNDVTPDNPKVQYYDSSESGVFQITFISSFQSDEINMLSFVSVVKNDTTYPQKECKTDGNFDDYYRIFNIDFDNGYAAYDQCTFNLYIPYNHELLLMVDDFYIENNADNLTLEDYSSNSNSDPIVINNKIYYFLTSNANDTLLNFQSDGSIQQAGFRMEATLLECECAQSNIVIPCSDYTDITPSSSSDNYCSNLQCNFILKPNPSCATNYFAISGISISLHQGDYISIYVNNQLTETITSYFSQRTFHSNDNVTLSFYSQKEYDSIYYDYILGYWTIRVEPITPPNFLSIVNLSNTSPTHVLWLADLNQNDVFTICLDGNDTLELFIPNFSTYSPISLRSLSSSNLFDSNNMDNFIATLDSDKITSDSSIIPRHISSSSGCFNIYQPNRDGANVAIFFRMQKLDSNNCLSNNVFNSISYYQSYNLSLEANSDGDCKMTILADGSQSMTLSNFFISSNASYSFNSALNQNEYFKLDSNNVGKWGPTKIFIPAFNIVIPSSKPINLTVTSYDSSYEYVDDNTGESDGIMASSSYGGIKQCQDESNALYTLAVPYPYDSYRNITLDVKSLDNNSIVIFKNVDDNVNITLTTNSSITQYGRRFYLYYNESCPGLSNGFLIKYSIIPFINSTTTTSYTTDTPPYTTSMTPPPTNFSNTPSPTSFTSTLGNPPPTLTSSAAESFNLTPVLSLILMLIIFMINL